jgi:integrase/recombinase XerD
MVRSNEALVNEFLTHIERTLRRAPGTVYKYRQIYSSFLLGVDKPLGTITTTDIEGWLGRERVGRAQLGVAAPATIKVEITTLRSLFKWLHSSGTIPSNPAASLVLPTVHNDDPKPVPPEVWRKVWFSSLPDDERVALGLGYFCGLRRHEVTGLSPEQFVDVPAPLILDLKRKGGKRGGFRWRSCLDLYAAKAPHLIGDPSLFVSALTRLLDSRRGLHTSSLSLLPWSRTNAEVWPVMFNKRMVSLALRMGVPVTEFTPHRLRHSFGTNLCAAGVPIQVVSKLMGHSSLAITQRYVDVGVDPLAVFLAQDVEPDVELRKASPRGGLV